MDDTIDLPSNLIPSFARGMEFLLVDHDRTSLVNTTSMLEQYTFKVTTTEESSVALSLIQEHKDRFKLVMASYNMPDMDCFTFLHKVDMNDIPVILISSRRSIKDAIKAVGAGAACCLDKPLSMDDLKYVWQHAYKKRKRPGLVDQNIATHDDNGHYPNNKGQGQEAAVEEEGYYISDQLQKMRGTQRKRKGMERESVRDDQFVMIDHAKAASRKRGKRGKGKEVAVEEEGLQVSYQQQKISGIDGKSKKMIEDQEALDGSDHQNCMMVDTKNARPKRSKRVRRVGNHAYDNKGKGKVEIDVLHDSDDDHLPQDKGKQIVAESLHEMDDQFMTTDACLALLLSMDTQGNSKQMVEEGLLGGEDQNVMIDVERKGKQIEEELTPVDKNFRKESENAGIEQNKLDIKKTNGQKGKEAIIVEATGGEEPATGEEEKKKARIAARAGEKGKGILEVADNEEEKEYSKKKPRLHWTPQLQHRFKTALQALGKDVRPKSIYEMMNVPDLSHRQIASHLQKYKAKLQRERKKSKHLPPSVNSNDRKSPSVSSYNGRYPYPYPYSPNPEVSKVLKKSREIMALLTREISNSSSRGHAYGFSRTPSFLAPDFSTASSRLSDNQVPLTSAVATETLNSSSVNFTTGHPFNATSHISMNKESDVNATLNPSPGNVANICKFPSNAEDGNWDSCAMTISDPTSANVPRADKYLTDFGPANLQADVPELWNTPASVSQTNAEEIPVSFGDGSQKSNAGAIKNPPYDLVPKTTRYSKKSNGVNQPLDALPISNATSDNMSGVGSLVIDTTDRMEEMDFMDNMLNLHEFLMDCNDDKQMAEVMAILDPALGNLPNASKFSVNCNDGVQEPKAMTFANPASGCAQNASNYRMDSATGNQDLDTRAVSFPPVCLPSPKLPHSEFTHLFRLLEEDSLEIEGVDAELNPGDVDRYCKSLRDVLDGSGP